MAYEIYKKQLTKKEYFDNWDSDNYKRLNEDLREQIYNKYLVKSKVFNRDNFTCQNINCKFPDATLTMHHVKWQKNGGEDKERNCVTLCRTCHKAYHRGKQEITFSENANLPSHMKGQTYKLSAVDEIDWKKVKKDMKNLRKTMKQSHGIRLSMSQVAFLMKWLEYIVDLDDLDD